MINPKISKYINSIKDRNIHVLGAAGSEGAAIVDFLYSHGIKNITAHDFQPDLKSFRQRFKQTHGTLTARERVQRLKNIINEDVTLHLKASYLKNINSADLIFLTQAWFIFPQNFPKLREALDRKIPVSSLIKLYLDLSPCPVIGITGSNGKSTTTSLVTEILKLSGHRVHTGGNIRGIYQQILPKIDKIKPEDFIVLEISNRQLAIDLQRSPHIAAITNIYPNHIEEHGSYRRYIKIKKSIFKYQNSSDYAVINRDLSLTKKLSLTTKGHTISFSIDHQKNDVYYTDQALFYNNQKIIDRDQIQLAGQHNLSNIACATAICLAAKIPTKDIRAGIKLFKGIPHRLEKIGTIEGRILIDDLKSTTPTATRFAINAFPQKQIHLIIGGDHKDVDYTTLAKTINKNITHLYTLPGSATDAITKLLPESYKNISHHRTIQSLLSETYDNTKKGDIILMSPSGAGFQEHHLHNKYSLEKLAREIFV